MHLKQLKLAGFKSFVDPTVVHFPSQLVAVVGPNGCGKSNIIDAVRWVMGESSARNLRGESMTDVIFNGSSNRKPVGQAFVELVFDNNLGRLTGPFASYGEIAVKRLVTRDGDSTYYLNGNRCRRKDITDIFLGTGAGARGYSIIGQGTISQLIEAKPEDLRVFLEEAAGVSKYKERKRETLQRIAHTRENLTRVADIREELAKQLQRLERQAKTAERYLILKEEEQLCRTEILALKWHDFVTQQELKQRQIKDLEISCEEQQSFLAKAQKERVVLNEQMHAMDAQTQEIQTTFYQLNTEIARLEETIQQQIREIKRLEQEQQQMQEDWHLAAERIKQDKEEFLKCQQNTQIFEKQVQQLAARFGDLVQQKQETEGHKAQHEEQWQEVQNKTNVVQREWQIAKVNAKHLDENHQQTLLRMEKLQLEQESISLDYLEQTKKKLQEQEINLIDSQELATQQLAASQKQTQQLRTLLNETEHQLHGLQDEFHHLNAEHAALIAAQRAARQSMQNSTEGIKAWAQKPRLMDVLQVENKWQTACERVLHDMLNAYVLDDFTELLSQRDLCEQNGEHIVTLKKVNAKTSSYPRLLDKIKGDLPAYVYSLEHIYTAEHVDEALNWLPQLAEFESIVTPLGVWFGKGWVKFVNSKEQDELGLLARQEKITSLTLIIQELQQKIEVLKTARDKAHQHLQKSIQENDVTQAALTSSNEALRSHKTSIHAKEQAIELAQKQVAHLTEESSQLQLHLEETVAKKLFIQEQLQTLEAQHAAFDEELQQCLAEKQKWSEKLILQNKQVEEARVELHEAERGWDREKNKIHQLDDKIQREQDRIDLLQERLEHLVQRSLQTKGPEVTLQEQLALQLQKHDEVESHLTLSREQLVQLKMQLEQSEKNILNCDLAVKGSQELIGQAKIEEQALIVRASSVQEALDEFNLQAAALLKNIREGTTQSVREEDLLVLTEKIKRLGAINLAAIEEFLSEQQRKIYLDEQYEDLNQALATLESAIEQMDKETQLRLEQTFTQVNTSFQQLFPRLFGGGRAQLELTCGNLLEAGIVVMAQPPGKRNSTIHLLSGGEKAMTAVALVFAIFQLNPSPFCMLDEVDAPLDDVNVGRFCTLVKEMSQFVQFLFITHNKVTMELADHLIGVTMREPGVSRLVTVDVTEALSME